jgi:hypothetical protein
MGTTTSSQWLFARFRRVESTESLGEDGSGPKVAEMDTCSMVAVADASVQVQEGHGCNSGELGQRRWEEGGSRTGGVPAMLSLPLKPCSEPTFGSPSTIVNSRTRSHSAT